MVKQSKIDFFQTPRQDQINYARRELGEEEDKLQHAQNLIFDWIDKTDYFPKNYDKNMVTSFLRLTKHNTERTKRKLESYYVSKSVHPELFANRIPTSNEMQTVFDMLYFLFLPNYTERGERILILKLRNSDPAIFNMEMISKMVFATCDLVMSMPHIVSGEIVILDGSDFSSAHFSQFMTQAFRTMIQLLRKAYPIRLKHIHIVNAPPMIEKMVGLVKPVLHEKIRKRFTIHKSSDSLMEYFTEKLLPREYGGFLKSIEEYSQEWEQILKDNSDWFRVQETVKIEGDPSKVRACIDVDSQGIQGSFRRLNID